MILAAAACGTQTPEPRLTAVSPAGVSTLGATPAPGRGIGLTARASLVVDDDRGGAQVDRDWQVRIDDVAVDASWIDTQTIDITIPRGLAIGVHDVVATAPRGGELRLPGALTVTGEPVGLVLSIEDAPGGTGHTVSATIGAGGTVSAYAVVRDQAHAFVGDASSTDRVVSGALAVGLLVMLWFAAPVVLRRQR